MKKVKRHFHFKIQVPASTSNLGPGFDVLGLAVKLYLKVLVEPSSLGAHLVLFKGEGSDVLSQERSNLILRVAQRVARAHQATLPPLKLTIQNEIPIAKGLGSSAAAIIVGVTIAEFFSRTKFSSEELLRHALEFESHPDNLTACLVGGLTAARLRSAHSCVYQSLSIDRYLKVVMAIPDFTISTNKARRILPRHYSRADAVSNLQNAVLLSHRLGKIDCSSPRIYFKDHFHQPYRAHLIPGLREALSLPEMPGLVGTYLSGSGSTLAALATKNFKHIGRALQNCFSKHGMSSKMAVLSIDRNGRRIGWLD